MMRKERVSGIQPNKMRSELAEMSQRSGADAGGLRTMQSEPHGVSFMSPSVTKGGQCVSCVHIHTHTHTLRCVHLSVNTLRTLHTPVLFSHPNSSLNLQ